MKLTFNARKAASNLKDHDVSFEEAVTVFFDPLHAVFPDDEHSWDEQRFIAIGESARGRILFVVYTETDSTVRPISARVANATERRNYEED